jgi:hypothetical protein
MTPEDVRREIERLSDHLLSGGLALDVGPTILRERPGTVRVSWEPREGAPSLLEAGRYGTIAEYQRLLEWRQFSVMLLDASLLQFTYEFAVSGKRRSCTLIKHRLSYVPCPLDIDAAAVAAEGLSVSEAFDLYLVECSERIRLRSNLRFDFDAAAGSHSRAHLTLVGEQCRWPVFGPLSVGHFIRFVFRSFYPELLETQPAVRDWAFSEASRSISEIDQGELYIECAPAKGRQLLDKIIHKFR